MKTHLTTITRRQQETEFQELISEYREAMAGLKPSATIASARGQWILTRNGVQSLHDTYQDAVHALSAQERSFEPERAA